MPFTETADSPLPDLSAAARPALPASAPASEQDARRRVEAVLAATEVGTWEFDIVANKIWADANLARMFGVTAEDAAGGGLEAYLNVIHSEDRAQVEESIDAALREGGKFVSEYRLLQKDGSYRSVIARGTVERDAEGNPLRMPGVILDVTERVQAERDRRELTAELERQRRTMEVMLASISDFVYIFDRKGCFIFVNKPLLDLWGLELKDAVGRNFFDLKYPDELAGTLQRQIQQVFDSRLPLTDRTPYTSTTGEGGFYEYIFSPVFSADGEVEFVAGSTRDITRDQVAIHVLKESETVFRQLADAMPQIVWSALPDGTLDYYNKRWYEFIGSDGSDLEVAEWSRHLHPEDLPGAAALWAEALRAGTPYTAEFRVRRADGEFRWFLVRALPLLAEGGISRWYGTCTDVHEQKRMEQERDELLASERAARNMAEHASRMKDEFLATLSHEIRSPLNAIFGWTQILREDIPDAETLSTGLEVIDRNVRLQTQLIEDLLDMSRIISGKLRLDVQQVHPASCIKAAVETVMTAAAAKGIRVQQVLDPHAGPMTGDPARVQQIVWNLLSNAIKFTPKGGKVQVTLQRVNSHLELSVADSGEGIKAEFLPHVFDRFRQEDAAMNRKHGGLGLGLAIVKQLVELHGGTIRVHSAGTGQGATFTVNLPLQAANLCSDGVERMHPQVPAFHPHFQKNSDLQGISVLVVDDEKDARELVRRILVDCKAEVTMAGSASEALGLIPTLRPHLVLSDIGMPDMDGYEFLRRLRKLDAGLGGETVAVALTAFARAEDRIKALQVGFLNHVSKPVEPTELVATIAAVARQARRRQG